MIATKPPLFSRKIIKMDVRDSPNVRYGLEEVAAGKEPSNRIFIPGMITYAEYKAREETWDPARKAVGLYAEFYDGPEQKLFPLAWRNAATTLALALKGKLRKPKILSCDPGEGKANTCWTIGDELGVILQISMVTPDTSVIPKETIALGREYKIKSRNWWFDSGGGGLEHCNELRDRGFRGVHAVGFGEAIAPEPSYGFLSPEARKRMKEVKEVYFNRRAQMYGEASELLNPAELKGGPRFAIPEECEALLEQLGKIPKIRDERGRLWLPAKSRKDPNKQGRGRYDKTLTELIGHSPDEADSFVLFVHGLLHGSTVGSAVVY